MNATITVWVYCSVRTKRKPVVTYTSRCQQHSNCIWPTVGLPVIQKNIPLVTISPSPSSVRHCHCRNHAFFTKKKKTFYKSLSWPNSEMSQFVETQTCTTGRISMRGRGESLFTVMPTSD